MSYKRDDPSFNAICRTAHERVVAVLRCLDILHSLFVARRCVWRTASSPCATGRTGACESRSSRLKP